MKKIIDVSKWNTVTDWNRVKKNVDAVIIRMGFTYSVNGYLCLDDKYVQYRKACEDLSIPHSFYFFTNATNVEEAEREAAFVVHECRDIKNYVLPVFVDTENVSGHGRADNLNTYNRTNCVRAFCSYLQRHGVPAGIYCSADWLKTHLEKNRLPFSLWIASWTTAPEDECLLWQYTSKGTVDGISGYVDLSTDSSKTSSVDKLISCLANEIGYCEKKTGNLKYLYTNTENAGSGNYTKYGYELHNKQPSNMDYPAAWCQAFISWGFVAMFGMDKAKYMLCGDIDDYTVTAAQRFKTAGRWYSTPQRGDLVYFGSNGGINHVGIVESVSSTSITTIEGNTGDKVQRHTYQLTNSRIYGYGRPKWG